MPHAEVAIVPGSHGGFTGARVNARGRRGKSGAGSAGRRQQKRRYARE